MDVLRASRIICLSTSTYFYSFCYSSKFPSTIPIHPHPFLSLPPPPPPSPLPCLSPPPLQPPLHSSHSLSSFYSHSSFNSSSSSSSSHSTSSIHPFVSPLNRPFLSPSFTLTLFVRSSVSRPSVRPFVDRSTSRPSDS